jgi:hypothetical protein
MGVQGRSSEQSTRGVRPNVHGVVSRVSSRPSTNESPGLRSGAEREDTVCRVKPYREPGSIGERHNLAFYLALCAGPVVGGPATMTTCVSLRPTCATGSERAARNRLGARGVPLARAV